MAHRYAIGQVLDLRSAPRQSNRPSGPCEVVACLPHERGPVLYRVKSLGESYERVVEEFDLVPSMAVKAEGPSATEVFSIAVSRR
ncbi:hypothetical protein [Devosia chinhatensis]|uniref:Uncharacterized protein n=1 Tax=Devosia chinhatensis TaxID=429727 RepID=A0A0F5FIH1_9HYPH|nr:hypothetical protein [Devosia chinhatensis]KKB08583.1 hypothetical protein VE26_00305 [Devosia chinhatensis]